MNKKRAIRITAYFVLLVLLLVYSRMTYPHLTLSMCLHSPDKFDGRLISVTNEITVSRITNDGFMIDHEGKDFLVRGTTKDLHKGEYITIKGIFHKEGWLELKDIHIANNRRLKIYLSMLPVLLIAIGFFLTFRFNFTRLCFEEKKHA